MPYCDFFLLQRCQILLWTLWLNVVIVTRIVPSWPPAKKTHKPSHNIIPTVLPSRPKEKHPIDWYNIWLLWGSSVSTQVTLSGKSEYLREQLICGYVQNLLFIVLGFSAMTSNETFKAKPPSHALTQNGWCAQKQAAGTWQGSPAVDTNRQSCWVQLHMGVMKPSTLKLRLILFSFRCVSDMLGCWIAWEREREGNSSSVVAISSLHYVLHSLADICFPSCTGNCNPQEGAQGWAVWIFTQVHNIFYTTLSSCIQSERTLQQKNHENWRHETPWRSLPWSENKLQRALTKSNLEFYSAETIKL